MSYFYISCTIWKPIHNSLVSDVNINLYFFMSSLPGLRALCGVFRDHAFVAWQQSQHIEKCSVGVCQSKPGTLGERDSKFEILLQLFMLTSYRKGVKYVCEQKGTKWTFLTAVEQSQFDGIKRGYCLSKPCGMSLCYRSTTQTVYTVCWAYATPMPYSSCPAHWRLRRSCCSRHSTLPTISFIASPAKCNAEESLEGFNFILSAVLWENFYYFKYICTFSRINEVNKLDKC